MSEELKVGDRVQVGGGYDMNPKWLNGNDHYIGVLKAFIPGQNENSAAVIELDAEINFDEVRGRIAVLELRYANAKWRSGETVHVELCDFEPERKVWNDRKQGKWVESHASIRKL